MLLKFKNNIISIEGIFMAFVYMSPRNIQLLKSVQYSPEPKICAFNNSQNNIPQQQEITKKPIKGLTFVKGTKRQQLQTEFYIVKNVEKMRQIKQKQNKYHKKQSEAIHNEQYFFKSKAAVKDLFTQNRKQSFQCRGDNLLINKNQTQNKMNKQNKLPHYQQNLFRKENKLYLNPSQTQNTYTLLQKGNLLNCKTNANLVYAIPSIPGKYQKFGYVIKQNKISYPQVVPRPKYCGEKQNTPGPTDYNTIQNKKIKNTPNFSKNKYYLSPKLESEDFYALIDDEQALKRHNQKIQQWVKQSKKRKKLPKQIAVFKKHKSRNLSTASNESGQTVYQDITTPGPGYYNNSLHESKKSFRSKNISLQKIFYSKSQRFEDQKQKKIDNSNVFRNQVQSQSSLNFSQLKKNKFFISKLKRQIKMERNSIAPSPDHYDIRIGIQNEIITKILRNSPNLFNNKLPRFANYDSSISPGPGAYCLDEPKFHVNSYSIDNKKQANSKLDNGQICKLSKFQSSLIEQPKEDNKMRIIHEKQITDQIVTPTFAPFLSNSPKGLETKLNVRIPSQFILQKYKPTKIKQNVYPFNSSDTKIKSDPVDYVAEVGLYQLMNNEWDKKSYNILFN